ncbi:hypothetical protein LWI28_010301 [Acer negundo]|uniref:Uncharacterized protein n=1 Tax=Acer negundo TaxID=4023 RepID=A0AAD5JD21_ACENE|nr:hypothetical protein LWI28_010301 [Acer negundo]
MKNTQISVFLCVEGVSSSPMAGVVGVRKVGLRIGDVDIVSMVSFTDGGVEEFIHARKQRKASCLQRRNLQQRVEEEMMLWFPLVYLSADILMLTWMVVGVN